MMLRLMLVGCLLGTVLPALAGESEQARIEALTARVERLESRLAQVLSLLAEDEAVVAEAIAPASPQVLPVRDMQQPVFMIGGRVKVDAIGNSRSTGGKGGINFSDLRLNPRSIPLDANGERNELSANARDSRLWLNVTAPTSQGNLGAYIEFDFGSFDDSGSERLTNPYNPRLRHAYTTFNGFTVGQTGTTFFNFQAFPELNDAAGPVGILNIRQPLVRYTSMGDRWRWSLAAEQPETTVRTPAGDSISVDDDRMPDMVARVDFLGGDSSVSVAGMLRQIRMDEALAGQRIDSSVMAGGLSASGRIYLGGADNLRFGVALGEGIGRYQSYNAIDAAMIDPVGDLQTIPTASAFVAYQHWWGRDWRSSVALGYTEADLDQNLVPDTVSERFLSTHVNVLWSPVRDATLGVEYIWGERELLGGYAADLHRLQMTALYKFRR